MPTDGRSDSPSMRLPVRIVVPVALAAFAGHTWLGGSAIVWAATGLLASIALAAVQHWYDTQGPGAVIRDLEALWLELPGALSHQRVISVHDGMQPLTIRVGRRSGCLFAVVQTEIGTTPVAWRVWSKDRTKPPITSDLTPHGGPPVNRVPALEAAFGSVVYVESNDLAGAARILDTTLRQAILGVKLEARTQWDGVTYDGRTLSVHFSGSTAADPQRATRLARSVWKVCT